METKEESTTNVDNVECQSYHKQGFCMKGENCQRTHASEAVTVPEYEFFSKWQVNVAVWKLNRPEEVSQKTEEEERLEKERERIRNNIAIKRRKDEENMAREQKREEKVRVRRKELQEKVAKTAVETIRNDDAKRLAENTQPEQATTESDYVLDLERCKGVDFNQPRIPPSVHYHVPVIWRQKGLDKLVAAYVELYSNMSDTTLAKKRAIIDALDMEVLCYEQSSNKSVYWQVLTSNAKSLKK